MEHYAKMGKAGVVISSKKLNKCLVKSNSSGASCTTSINLPDLVTYIKNSKTSLKKSYLNICASFAEFFKKRCIRFTYPLHFIDVICHFFDTTQCIMQTFELFTVGFHVLQHGLHK